MKYRPLVDVPIGVERVYDMDVKRTDAPKIRDFIQSFIAGDRLPDFNLLHTKSKFLFKTNIRNNIEKSNRTCFTTDYGRLKTIVFSMRNKDTKNI